MFHANRSSWAYYHKDASEIARQVAGWMSQINHWSEAKTEEELSRYEACMRYTHNGSPPGGTAQRRAQAGARKPAMFG